MNKEWHTEKPPHEQVVEIEFLGEIIQARAIWGDPDKGVLPHWELSDGRLVDPRAINRWRHI